MLLSRSEGITRKPVEVVINDLRLNHCHSGEHRSIHLVDNADRNNVNSARASPLMRADSGPGKCTAGACGVLGDSKCYTSTTSLPERL